MGADVVADALAQLPHREGTDQLVVVGEVVPDRADGESGFIGDVAQRRLLQPVLADDGTRLPPPPGERATGSTTLGTLLL